MFLMYRPQKCLISVGLSIMHVSLPKSTKEFYIYKYFFLIGFVLLLAFLYGFEYFS